MNLCKVSAENARLTWVVLKLKLRVAFRAPTATLILGYFVLSGFFAVATVQAVKAKVFEISIQPKIDPPSIPDLNATASYVSKIKQRMSVFKIFRYLGPAVFTFSMTR